MIAESVERITEPADGEGWIVLGGIHRVVTRQAAQLAASAPHRVLEIDSLAVQSTDAETSAAASTGAPTLRGAYDARRLNEIRCSAR